MMTLISEVFEKLKASNGKALITYLMAGDPDIAATIQAMRAITAAGADIIELGVPFSDPLADGPTIQSAATRALKAGTTPGDVIGAVRTYRSWEGARAVPVALMVYMNNVLARSASAFVAEAASAGVSGLIIPDLPYDEASDLIDLCREAGIDLVLLAAPTSTPERLASIAAASSGFIYAVSVTGVTGARSGVPEGLSELIDRIRAQSDLPVAVGFGIATPEDAAKISELADGVVVGSALVSRLHEGMMADDGLSRAHAVVNVAEFVASLKAAISSVTCP